MTHRMTKDPVTHATVPCGICETPTPMLGTKRCNRCWELEWRIKAQPDLALKVIASIIRGDR